MPRKQGKATARKTSTAKARTGPPNAPKRTKGGRLNQRVEKNVRKRSTGRKK